MHCQILLKFGRQVHYGLWGQCNCEIPLPVKSKMGTAPKLDIFRPKSQQLRLGLFDCVEISYVSVLWVRVGCGLLNL